MFVSLLVYYLACARVAPALIGAGRISVQLWLLLQDAAARLSRGPVAIKKRRACKQTQPQRFASSRAALLWLRVQEPPCPDNNGHFPHYAPRDDGVRSLHESSLAKVQQSQESEEFSIFSLSSRLRRLRKKRETARHLFCPDVPEGLFCQVPSCFHPPHRWRLSRLTGRHSSVSLYLEGH